MKRSCARLQLMYFHKTDMDPLWYLLGQRHSAAPVLRSYEMNVSGPALLEVSPPRCTVLCSTTTEQQEEKVTT